MTYDNICKYLAEKYPSNFVCWLFSAESTQIQVLKTELSLEPIRADCVTLLQTSNQILHLEFQTLPPTDPPMPLRMLDYWVRLHRQYRCPVEQVVIYLKYTTSESAFVEQFVAANTWHRYRVIRMWEQDPQPLLADSALLPLAALAQTNSPRGLLERVATQVGNIESTDQQQNVSACVQMLAGLRFEKNLIRQLFREEIMRESVIYQDILQKGLQQGKQEGELAVVLRQLTRRIGTINPEVQERLRQLSIPQLEDLAEALLDFSDATDLTDWLSSQGS